MTESTFRNIRIHRILSNSIAVRYNLRRVDTDDSLKTGIPKGFTITDPPCYKPNRNILPLASLENFVWNLSHECLTVGATFPRYNQVSPFYNIIKTNRIQYNGCSFHNISPRIRHQSRCQSACRAASGLARLHS